MASQVTLQLRQLGRHSHESGNSDLHREWQLGNGAIERNSFENASDAVLENNSPIEAVVAEQEMLPVTKSRQIIVLLSSFMAVFQTIGINQAYGVFQSHYISPGREDSILPLSEAQNKALIAFVGTLGAGLTWSGSIFVNPLMARSKDLRKLTFPGAFLMSLGYLLASFSTRAWHLLLTQGLIYGVGSSLLYFPLLSIAPEYFSARRGAAMGFILSGAGIGGLVFSPAINAMLSRVGVKWTLRFVSVIILGVSLPVAFATSPSRSRTRRPTLVNARLALKPTFILQTIAALLQTSGNSVPLTFLPEFSIALGYTSALGAILLAVNNGVNSVARIATGALADICGRQNTLIVSVIGSAVSVVALWLGAAASSAHGLWISFVILYGITSGGYNALFPTTITDVFGIQAYASVNGFIYFVRGLGAFFGSPVAGLILGREKESSLGGKDFKSMIYYDAALLFSSCLCVIGVRAFDALDKGEWKWMA